jgi:hypothetical protein
MGKFIFREIHENDEMGKIKKWSCIFKIFLKETIMADSDGGGAVVLGIIALVIAYFIIVYIILPMIGFFLAGGAIWGGGTSIYNYFVAFKNNVKPETV